MDITTKRKGEEDHLALVPSKKAKDNELVLHSSSSGFSSAVLKSLPEVGFANLI